MTLQKHCCSLALSKQLKHYKIPQQSYFVWSCAAGKPNEIYLKRASGNHSDTKDWSFYSAFMLSELAKFFPRDLEWYSGRNIEPRKWSCAFKDTRIEKILGFNGKTEVDARAKLLIHLLKKGRVNV